MKSALQSHIVRRRSHRTRLVQSLRLVGFGLFLVLANIGGFLYTRASAAPNAELNFQARLLSATGAIVPDGNSYSVQFKLYNVASGGTAEWTETQSGVTVKAGYLSVHLGSVTPFPGTIDWSQQQWLTMNVNSDGEMSPRLQLTSVPAAFHANEADALRSGSNLLDADDFAQLAPGTPQVISSALAALRLNQTGAGGLLQLQNGGTDVFTVGASGSVNSSGSATFSGGTLNLGSFSQSGALVLYDGSSNTGTIQTNALGQNTTYHLPDSGLANVDICLSTGNCGGTGDISQNGNSFGTAVTIGSNDNFGLNFETNGTNRLSIDTSGNVDLLTGELRIAGTSVLTAGRALQNLTGITSSGTVTFSGLGAGLVQSSSGGVLSSGAVDRNSATYFNTALTVANGGTGGTSFTSNGVLYGNGSSALQVTSAGTGGQVLLANSSGIPTFTTISGDATLSNTGVLTVANGAITNAKLQNSSFNTSFGTNLSGSASVSLGGTLTVNFSATPTFTSITANALSSATSSDLTLTADTGIINLAANTTFKTTSGLDIDLNNASNQTLRLLNNGAGIANLNLSDGNLLVGGSTVLTSARALQNLTGISTTGSLVFNSFGGSTGLLKVDSAGNVSLTTAGTDYEVPLTFSNGLTRTGNAVTLGGTLTGVTDIATGSNNLTLSGNGFIGIGSTSAQYKLDVRTPGVLASQVHVASSNTDAGGYLLSVGDNHLLASGGAAFNGTNWVAKATTASIYGSSLGGSFIVQTGSGLTVGNTFTPTTQLTVTNSGATFASTLAVNGGSLSSSASSFTLLAGPTTVNAFTGATTLLNIGNVAGTTTLNGSNSLGDDSTDTLTIKGTAVSIPNNLNFDSDTLFIDAANNRVGIGDSTPDAKLEVLSTTEQLRLSYADGTDSHFTVDSSGNLTVDNSGSKTILSDDLQLGTNNILDSAATTRLTVGSTNAFTGSLTVSVNTDIAGTLAVGTNDAFNVNADGDVTAVSRQLDGSSTANGSSGLGSSTSLTLASAANFDIGNYVRVTSNNCGGTGINPCYAKITAKATNTLTITPALTWANGSAVVEFHIPEIGGIDTAQTLANRYGRGYFISGVATGNGTTYYNESSIETSLTTFDLLSNTTNNPNLTSILIGNSSTTTTVAGTVTFTGNVNAPNSGTAGYIQRSGTTLSPTNAGDNFTTSGNISTTSSGTITSAGALTVQSGGAAITGNTTISGTLSGLTGVTFTSGALNLASGGITNAGSIAGVTTINASGAITAATSSNTINGLIINSGALSGISTLNASGLATTVGLNAGTGLIQGTGGLTITGAAVSLNASSNFAVNIGTGSTNQQITIGGGSAPLVIDSTNFDVSSAGALSGITTIGLSGAITGATSGNTINGLIINSGALSGISTINASGLATTVGLNAGSGLIQGTGGLTITGAAVNLNASSNFAVNIGTGSTNQQISIGGGSAPLVIDSTAFDVSSAGALSGITTIGLSGAITGATSGNTINGLIINSGALSGITGFSQTSGAHSVTGSGAITFGAGSNALTIDSSAFDVSSAGALSGITTIGLSGAITGATATNTINGLVINSGALTSVTGITFTSGNLALGGGNITGVGNFSLTGSVSGLTYMDFSTSASNPAYQEGRLFYDNTQKALSYYNSETQTTLNIGQEDYVYVYNNTGSTITDGQAVYITGVNAGVPTVALARADSLTTSRVAGVATHSIENNTFGFITAFGEINGLNTSSFASGDTLYLSAVTAGLLTNTRPAIPNVTTIVARVTDVNASTGKITVLLGDATEGAFTTGRLAFGTSNGMLIEDSNLSWDNTNKRLALGGDVTPDALLSVGSTSQFQVSTTGAITGVGLTSAGAASSFNLNSNFAFDVNTGTSTGTITLGGGSAPLVINSTNFDVSSAGALSGITTINTSGLITSVGHDAGAGLIQGTLGLTISGAAISLNNSSNFATNINTGTSSGTVTIGGGSAPLVINSTNFDVSSAGALSGITTINASGLATTVGLTAGAGLIQGTLGLTITGAAVSLNASSNFAINIGTGTSTGAVTLGGGSNTFTVASTGIDISANAISDANTLTSVNNTNLTLNANGTGNLVLTGYDCSGQSNGGTLTTNASGVVSCQADDAGLSDARLKKNVTNLNDDILTRIKDVRTVNFDFDCDQDFFKDQTLDCRTDRQTGVIAQELGAIFPELVEQGDDGYYRVKYDSLNIYTLKAVTELAAQVESATNTHNSNEVSTGGVVRLDSEGRLQNITGLNLVSGSASLTGGIDNNGGGISEAGAITGATNIDAQTLHLTANATDDMLKLTKDDKGVFTIFNNGALLMKLDATNTFSVQDANGIGIFNIDSLTGRVSIGSGDTNKTVLFTLDNRALPDDPPGTNGSSYYNTVLQRFRCYQEGKWSDCLPAGDLSDPIALDKTTWLQPNAEQEFPGTPRILPNLERAHEFRLRMRITSAGATGATCRLQYATTDAGPWNDLFASGTGELSISQSGTLKTGWLKIAEGARHEDIVIRTICNGGDSSHNVTFYGVSLQLR